MQDQLPNKSLHITLENSIIESIMVTPEENRARIAAAQARERQRKKETRERLRENGHGTSGGKAASRRFHAGESPQVGIVIQPANPN